MRREVVFITIVLTTASVLSIFSMGKPFGVESARSQTVTGRVLEDRVERAGDALVRQGEYVVHHVAMCVECHTPRGDDGELDRHQLLTGAPIPLQSPYPKKPWAFRAPSLVGLPGGWTEPQLVRFLQTGETPNGHAVQSPMPPFRLNQEDARAVAADLRSLRP